MQQLKTTRNWYLALQTIQQDFIALRVMNIIPFSPIRPLSERANEELLKLFEMYKGFLKKKTGRFYTVYAPLIYILRDYPENEVDFLDFFNRAGFINHAPEYIKEQLLSDNPDAQDFVFALYLSQRQAKDSWEALIDRDFTD